MSNGHTKTVTILIGVLVAALAYYAMATVPPGMSLPLNTESGSTRWSNISFHEDTSGSAEVMYFIRVDHSPLKAGISIMLGALAAVMVLWRGSREA